MKKQLYRIYYKMFHYKEVLRVKLMHFHIAALYTQQATVGKNVYFGKFCSVKIEFDKAKLIINNNVVLKQNCSINIGENGRIEIGENVFFNSGCSINSLKNIQIDKNSILGENVKFYDHNHQYKNIDKDIKEQGYTVAPIIVEKNCWIGSNVIILKGVRIGQHSVIGANCIINSDVPQYSLVIVDNKSQKIKSII